MRVALDATPMIGTRTGIGIFVDELLRGIRGMEQQGTEVEITAYTLSIRARLRGETHGVWVPLPASRAPTIWRWFRGPRIETFVGAVDVVHGTNYLVPPSAQPRVVTVHDLSFLRDSGVRRASTARFDRAVA
ncbi:MAG: glycosyltransferase family 1 protein, partial [Actinomycetota bacterium]|nr:glycosyltransferase family 1 protein [Actinomycetota bacterium]